MRHLICPVRGCGEPLARAERRFACPRGHSFDLARSGYLNLLQPQDRRAPEPGDAKTAVAARRRLYQAGLSRPLARALADLARHLSLPAHPVLLDVGCGEGTLLAQLAPALGATAYGLDLSAGAIDLAARTYAGPALTWLVANADRGLPLAPASVHLALSIAGRRPVAELTRVVAPGGWLILAVPSPDDLRELRRHLLGDADARDRLPAALAEFTPAFQPAGRLRLEYRPTLPRPLLADLATATYRLGRASREGRVERLPEEMMVTLGWELGWLRR